jgi:hypothetical protein
MEFNAVNALLNSLVLALSVFGVSFVLFYTDGPFRVFVTARAWLRGMIGREERSTLVYISEEFFSGLFDCFWCFSLWIALVLGAVFTMLISIPFGEATVTVLAAYGISGYMHERVASG